MTPRRNIIAPRNMQDFLEALSRRNANPEDEQAKRDLIRAFAEIQFCIHGGSKCSICHAHVRHVLPIVAERPDQTVRNYDCLCTRCFESERVASTALRMELGETTVRFRSDGSIAFEEPDPASLRRHGPLSV